MRQELEDQSAQSDNSRQSFTSLFTIPSYCMSFLLQFDVQKEYAADCLRVPPISCNLSHQRCSRTFLGKQHYLWSQVYGSYQKRQIESPNDYKAGMLVSGTACQQSSLRPKHHWCRMLVWFRPNTTTEDQQKKFLCSEACRQNVRNQANRGYSKHVYRPSPNQQQVWWTSTFEIARTQSDASPIEEATPTVAFSERQNREFGKVTG